MTNYIIWICILVVCESFFKNCLLGVIKALEQQKRALMINIFSYLVMVVPLSIFFAFKVQDYGWFVDTSPDTNNRGLALWIGFIIGIGFQVLGYLHILMSTDWQEASDFARIR